MLLLHFLRLVRFGNLMVMGVTMCIVQVFIVTHETSDNYKFWTPSDLNAGGYYLTSTIKDGNSWSQFWSTAKTEYGINGDFILLMLSVILIAGAGNIINDYFDVKADRVNKPEKLVVGKHIKRRWAIMWNWILNVVGFSFAIYISVKYENIWIAVIALLTINFLWFYSALYKRKIIVGNIIVAFLVGLVPLYVLIYNTPIEGFSKMIFGVPVDFGSFFIIKVVAVISTIAFVVNLMREIIKDMADIRGDMHLEARTVPIALGIKRTKLILVLLLIPLLLLMAFFIFDVRHMENSILMMSPSITHSTESAALFPHIFGFICTVVASGLICVIAFTVLLTKNTRSHYLLSSNLLKIAMLFGIISPLFL